MKSIITLLFAALAFSANAQFTLLPQAGIDQSKATIQSNDFSALSKAMTSPQVGLRLSYTAKTGSGAFFGISSGSPATEFKFNDPQTASTSYKLSGQDMQFRIEGGYQFTTKPIALSKPHYFNKPSHRFSEGQQHNGYGHYGSMHNGSHSPCGQHNASNHFGKSSFKAMQNKGLYMRIVPSLGLAYAPAGKSEIETETRSGQTFYEYNAGSKTSIIAGTAFQFGSRNQTKFVVSLNYLKGLGNNMQTLNTTDLGKTTTTAHTYQSSTSSFNVSIGIPINLKKSSKATTPQAPHRQCSGNGHCMGRCGQYRMFFQQ